MEHVKTLETKTSNAPVLVTLKENDVKSSQRMVDLVRDIRYCYAFILHAPGSVVM